MTTKNYPPTTKETPGCPPHHWFVNKQSQGICFKCLAEKDFSELTQRGKVSGSARLSNIEGGKRSRGRPRKMKGKE